MPCIFWQFYKLQRNDDDSEDDDAADANDGDGSDGEPDVSPKLKADDLIGLPGRVDFAVNRVIVIGLSDNKSELKLKLQPNQTPLAISFLPTGNNASIIVIFNTSRD